MTDLRKPLTKALHTRRVVYQVARYVVRLGNAPAGGALLLGRVCDVLGNEFPDSPALLAELTEACREAWQDEYRGATS